MGNSYYGLLRGRVLPIEISARALLKDSEDSIFLLETGQMCGYTTRKTMERMIKHEQVAEQKNSELDALLEEFGKLRYDNDLVTASQEIKNGMPLLQWLGID